jgi:hypothetical protein
LLLLLMVDDCVVVVAGLASAIGPSFTFTIRFFKQSYVVKPETTFISFILFHFVSTR